jgi:hypothetical protein
MVFLVLKSSCVLTFFPTHFKVLPLEFNDLDITIPTNLTPQTSFCTTARHIETLFLFNILVFLKIANALFVIFCFKLLRVWKIILYKGLVIKYRGVGRKKRGGGPSFSSTGKRVGQEESCNTFGGGH